MAVEFIAWALEQDIPTGPKFVLVALANRANQDGECWPSQEDIAKQTNIARPTVNGHIKKLCDFGLIEKRERRREDGYKSSSKYILRKNFLRKKNTNSHVRKSDNNIYPTGISETSVEPSSANAQKPSRKSTLPEWLNPDLWQEYRAHRKQLRKPLTKTAEARAITKLERMRASGHDPTAVIEQSLENGWTGLFEPKEESKHGNTINSGTSSTKAERIQRAKAAALRDIGVEEACF